ncbi:hypothetical protein EZS27_016784 [termite gut metagenome]|jgi:hypothetical protein|uniref:Uncharacterized protein n=1 Tax=termite gut metagenome TaxID=433724 RepID=A0A5J4RMY4_9ZZZZ
MLKTFRLFLEKLLMEVYFGSKKNGKKKKILFFTCSYLYNQKTKPQMLDKVQQPDFCNIFIW